MHDEVIFDVLVEQLEYLSKADVARIAKGANQPQQKPVAIVDKNGETAHDEIPEAERRAAAAGALRAVGVRLSSFPGCGTAR